MIKPTNEQDLSEAIRQANGPLQIKGGGTRGVRTGGNDLTASGLAGISLYEPGALTIVAGAGTPLAEIEAALDAENQRLAFEPMDHRALLGTSGQPTIGGVFAANVSGPRRIQAGAARDFLLGVRFADGEGNIIRNGGRVMKNVTGYDLVKLMCGSWGTLGVLSEVSLKVLPKAETQLTLHLAGLDTTRAVQAMSAALGSPFEVSGASFGAIHQGGEAVVSLRIEGFEASVRYRAEKLRGVLGGFGPADICDSADMSREIWAGIRDAKVFQDAPGDVWRISVKPGDAPALIEQLEGGDVLLDWGGGLIWARVPEGTDLRARMAGIAGHATLVRADAQTRLRLGMFHPEPAPLAAISAGLRKKFDPRGILNPGLMGQR